MNGAVTKPIRNENWSVTDDAEEGNVTVCAAESISATLLSVSLPPNQAQEFPLRGPSPPWQSTLATLHREDGKRVDVTT